ncbi:MAG TPA: metallophosphoesterase family protein [Gaiellaceae bacterium]|nr:metallophosphoesterase family protein [Gaiellaceae bacterium]
MRVAVISDIHANYHALEAVFAAIDLEQPDDVWCLGDLVGYGPQPNRCCIAIAGRATLSLCGNHDLAVLGTLSIETFTPDAAEAARWSAGVLADDARSYLAGLLPSLRRKDAELYHGSPRDPVWDYVMTEEAAFDSLALTTAPLVLVGHTHLPLALTLRGNSIIGGLAPGGTEVELGETRWLLNPGSVGQPRDGDSRAAWLMLDLDEGVASFRRTEYPIERTQAEITELGLPAALATRLALGQ